MRNVEDWEVGKPIYSNPYRWAPSPNAEEVYPADKGWKYNGNYVTYAPMYLKSGGEVLGGGGRRVHEPFRGDVTDDVDTYK